MWRPRYRVRDLIPEDDTPMPVAFPGDYEIRIMDPEFPEVEAVVEFLGASIDVHGRAIIELGNMKKIVPTASKEGVAFDNANRPVIRSHHNGNEASIPPNRGSGAPNSLRGVSVGHLPHGVPVRPGGHLETAQSRDEGHLPPRAKAEGAV